MQRKLMNLLTLSIVTAVISGCQSQSTDPYGLAGKNFVTKIIDVAKTGKDINIVDDQVGSPTATTEVAALTGPELRYPSLDVVMEGPSAEEAVKRLKQ